MTDEHKGEPIPFTDLTPEQIAARLGMSLHEARELLTITRGEWCGDVIETGPDGLARPLDHGDNWNPGKGEARSRPWPDGTYGRKRRRRGGTG